MKLHVAAVDGYALRWLIGRLLSVEPRAFEPLAQGKRDDSKANATIEARDGGQCRSLVRVSVQAALLHHSSRAYRRLLSIIAFNLQIATKSKWTRGDSNPWPPPCEGGTTVCCRFLGLAKPLQIQIFGL
jgi:hypothetical protein